MLTRSAWCVTVWCVAAMVGSLPVLAQQQQPMEFRTGVGRAGVGFYSVDEWGVVQSSIVNHQSTPQRPLLVLSSDASSHIQFARRLWLPPDSRLTALTPIKLLRGPLDDNIGIQIEARLIDDGGGREINIDPRPQIGAVAVRDAEVEIAMMRAGMDDATADASIALRSRNNLPQTTAYVTDEAAPPLAAGWDAVDVLIISREHPQLDPAQMEAIRQWVVQGGRLWINLHRVDAAFARRLLPYNWNVTVLDRVELTDFRIVGGDAAADGGEGAGGHHVQVDYPYEMVRVVAPDMEPIHTVGGWPASMRIGVGQGELLVTTLEASAWMTADNQAAPWLTDLLWLVRRTGPADAEPSAGGGPTVLEAMAHEQIGTTVLSRGPVLLVLSLFALALAGCGLMLAQRGGLAHLGWLAPGLAVVAAVVILGLGVVTKSADPLTLASSQWIEVAPDEPYAVVESLVSVYTPPFSAPADEPRLSGSGAVAWPDLTAHGGKIVRLLWTDTQHWTYPNLALREGSVQTAARRLTAPLDRRVSATVRFSEAGLTGAVETGSMGPIRDAVLWTPTGKLPPTFQGEGAFTAPPADPLGVGQFFTAGVLGQRQMARQEIYRQLDQRPGFPRRPMLVGWTDGLDLGVTLSEQAENRRTALVAIPLRIQPPEPGQRIVVPPAFFSVSQFGPGAAFDARTGGFVPNIQQPQTIELRFQLPPELRDLRIDEATIRFELDAPGRPYAVLVRRGDQVREVASGQGAAGREAITVSGADVPLIDDSGSIVVGLRIGALLDPLSAQPWTLTQLNVGVAGVVGPADPAAGGDGVPATADLARSRF